ncbi:MAG TPA: ABC transporter substrate-binding protein [Mycobacteriales bacterium]|nr:ABC transporter substrate-binding protein [Mycobacteriales bacterium]
MRPSLSRRLTAAGALAALFLTACSGAKAPVTGADATAGSDGSADLVTDPSATPSVDGSASPGAVASGKASAAASAKPGTKPGTTTATSGSTGRAPGGTSGGGSTTKSGNDVVLWTGADNTKGITSSSILMCAHAALTYGAAFDTSKDDFNVYWSAVNDAGGIYGREVDVAYENDNYTPTDAITAATNCEAKNPFMLIGGIGFDQIPAVRNWAEDHKMLYLHHTATVKGSEGKKYSFTSLPTVEKLGEAFGELALQKYKGKKIGIIHRDSVNWDPGYDAFLAYAKAKGLNIVGEAKSQNDHNHLQRVLTIKDSGAEVVWLWENALVSTEVITTADQQQYRPQWMLFPFNLTTQTLKDAGIKADMLGIAAWPAYSYQDHSGPFAPYAADIKLFEQQYARYRPNAKLNGLAGDLLFLNWVGQKALHEMFIACGKDCTRNKFASLMHNGYKATAQGCSIDFSRNPHRGSYQFNVFDTYDSPTGRRNWRPMVTCREHL